MKLIYLYNIIDNKIFYIVSNLETSTNKYEAALFKNRNAAEKFANQLEIKYNVGVTYCPNSALHLYKNIRAK